MSKGKRLGRGLEALLGAVAAAQPNADAGAASAIDAAELTTGSDGLEDASLTSETDERATIVSFVQMQNERRAAQEASVPPAATQVSIQPPPASTPGDDWEAEKDRALADFSAGRVASEIPVELVDCNPFQPRLDFDEAEMRSLAASIAQHGMIQPIVARKQGERYEIVAGERRFRAAKMAGWEKVPAHFLVVDDREMAELALTENMQRRDLNPIEKALAFRAYLDSYGGTHEELAKRLDLDRSTVTNLTRLLDLPEEIQTMTRRGDLTQGHARALLPLEEWDQLELARRVAEEKLSVRQTEAIVKEFLENSDQEQRPASKPKTEVSPRVRDLEQQFRSWLGMKVKLTSNDK
ncbi:MAG: ParB/RepB/Spo0J family partition protein, partial [Thermoguttaceae bacterium]|nr:ParB/RepB/Spo0J family partition protein [Thermoguttaceae bacterium]